MKPVRMARSIAKNIATGRRCNVEGCTKPVFEFGAYCKSHHRRRMKYGHPLATPILRSELRPYRRVVGEFLSANSRHPSVIEAAAFFDLLLRTAAAKTAGTLVPKVKAAEALWHHLSHSHSEGTTGLELLTETLVVVAFAQHNPRRIRSTEHERVVIARRVLQVKPWRVSRWINGEHGQHHYKELGRRMLRDLSHMIASKLGRFLIEAAREANRRHHGPPEYFEPITVSAPFASSDPPSTQGVT